MTFYGEILKMVMNMMKMTIIAIDVKKMLTPRIKNVKNAFL